MTVFELLYFHKDLLRMVSESGLKAGDYRFAGLYDDYLKMESAGDKKTYIVAVLADKYGISERKVYDVLRRLSEECGR